MIQTIFYETKKYWGNEGNNQQTNRYNRSNKIMQKTYEIITNIPNLLIHL